VPQADRAWAVLTAAPPPVISVTGRVQHVGNRPDTSAALYLREGWTVGQQGRETLRLRRTSGPEAPVTYETRLLGDTDTFRVPSRVTLPLRRPVAVPIAIDARREGMRSALLDLIDSASGTVVQRLPLTVVAAHRLSPDAPFTRHVTLRVAHREEYAVMVPEGTAALTGHLRMSCGATMHVNDPHGWPYPRRLPASLGLSMKEPSERFTIPDPTPGTWIVAFARADETCPDKQATIDLALAAAPAIRASVSNEPDATAMTVTVAGTTGPDLDPPVYLASTSVHSGTVADGEPWTVLPIDVKPGTPLMRLSLDHADTTPLGLYLYDCTGPTCLRFAAMPPSARPHVLAISQPASGRWKAVIGARDGTAAAPAPYRLVIAGADGATALDPLGVTRDRKHPLRRSRDYARRTTDETPEASRALLVTPRAQGEPVKPEPNAPVPAGVLLPLSAAPRQAIAAEGQPSDRRARRDGPARGKPAARRPAAGG